MNAIAAPSFDRSRAIEFGTSALVHVVLFAGLSLALLTPPKPPPPPAPMDVTIADDVGLVAAAPQSETPPAPSQAPELGKPEEAAPPAPAPEAVEPASKPKPAPPAPAPKPVAIARPQPVKKPSPAPPQPAKPQTRAPSGALAGVVGRAGKGSAPTSTARSQRGSTLGSVMNGVGETPNKSKSTTPQGAVMNAAAKMDIRRKIQQLVQPCANRQVSPGPGAEDVDIVVRLSINRDGTLASRPQARPATPEDGRKRYAQQVEDRAISVFMGCQPLRGLPLDLYDVPGGWKDFDMTYHLPR